MKKIIITGIIGMLLSIVACNNNKNNNQQQIATTPVLSSDCMVNAGAYNGTNCNFAYGQHIPFQNYPYNNYDLSNRFSNGFCGCGNNATAVYNNSWGLGCISRQYLTTSQYIYYFWDYSNTQWVNVPQTNTGTSYYSGYNNNSCYQSLVACDASNVNSCGGFGQCTPVSNTNIGVCQYRPGYSYQSSYQYSNFQSGNGFTANPYYNGGPNHYYGAGFSGGYSAYSSGTYSGGVRFQ
jgi:hypothetical protein